jgi:hypothetical protein
MVCLGNQNEEHYDGLLKMLDVLLSTERDATEKKKVLKEDFGIEMTKTMESEVHNMGNLGERLVEKGVEQGVVSTTLKLIQSLMETMQTSAENAMKALKIPESEMPQYANMLKRR